MEEFTSIFINKLLEYFIQNISIQIDQSRISLKTKNAIVELFKKYNDENFYMVMDKYLSQNNVIEKIVTHCENYITSPEKFSITKFANEFYENNKSNISYFGIGYIRYFFIELFQIIFNLKYQVEKFSIEEAIIAHNKKHIQELEETLQNCILSLQKELSNIKAKINQNNIVLNDKKFHFIEMYESPLFLEDSNACSLTLKDIYIPPRYKEKGRTSNNLNEYLEEFMFGQNSDSVLFIVGQPSVGKSSLIADLVYKYKYRNDIIALPMKPIDGNESLLNGLRKELRCNDSDLEGTILILDGYDETKVVKEKDANVNKICLDFITDLQHMTRREKALKVIMTIRTGYFELEDWEEKYNDARVIEIQDLNKEQIKQFQKKYLTKKNMSQTSSDFISNRINKKDLGIIANPMMLYMICHFGGALGGRLNKAQIYEKIFSRKGSLFTSIYKGKGRGEDEKTIAKCYEIIETLSFEVFNTNSSTVYEVPSIDLINDNDLRRFTGMTINMKSRNKGLSIEFRHMSICYYFVAEYIYYSLYNICSNEKTENEEVLKTIDKLFSSGNMENEIFEFLLYFIETRDLIKKEAENKILLNSLEYILTRNCISILNGKLPIVLLDRIHNTFNGYWKIFTAIYSMICKKNNKDFILRDLIKQKNTWKNIARLLKNGSFYKLCMRGADLSGNDLRGAIIRESDFSFAELQNADLRGASLIGSKFGEANLENANLNGADLCKAKFSGALLRRLKLRGSVLKECDFTKYKTIDGAKFSYSNIMHIKNIAKDDLKECFVYNEQGKLLPYLEFIES